MMWLPEYLKLLSTDPIRARLNESSFQLDSSALLGSGVASAVASPTDDDDGVEIESEAERDYMVGDDDVSPPSALPPQEKVEVVEKGKVEVKEMELELARSTAAHLTAAAYETDAERAVADEAARAEIVVSTGQSTWPRGKPGRKRPAKGSMAESGAKDTTDVGVGKAHQCQVPAWEGL